MGARGEGDSGVFLALFTLLEIFLDLLNFNPITHRSSSDLCNFGLEIGNFASKYNPSVSNSSPEPYPADAVKTNPNAM